MEAVAVADGALAAERRLHCGGRCGGGGQGRFGGLHGWLGATLQSTLRACPGWRVVFGRVGGNFLTRLHTAENHGEHEQKAAE